MHGQLNLCFQCYARGRVGACSWLGVCGHSRRTEHVGVRMHVRVSRPWTHGHLAKNLKGLGRPLFFGSACAHVLMVQCVKTHMNTLHAHVSE